MTEQREINFIAEQEWRLHLEWRADPRNAKVVEFSDRLFSALNSLGYDIQWGFSMQPATFHGDMRIFPICRQFIEEAGEDEELEGCMCMAVWVLAHKNMKVATEFLIQQYRGAIARGANNRVLSYYAQAIAKIKDRRYIEDYLQLTNPATIVYESAYLVELLGQLKVHEAENQIIQLVDIRIPPPKGRDEKFHYDVGLHLFVSSKAMKALGMLKSKKALPVIEKYLNPEHLPGFFPNDRERKDQIRKFRDLAQKTIAKIKCETSI